MGNKKKRMKSTRRILIADDHPIFRSGIKEIIKLIHGVDLVAECGNGLEAYQAILAHHPEIAILDLDMPMLNGLDVCKKVINEKHQTKFIILTMHKEKHFFTDAIQHGVMGYLLKDHAETELIECINEVRKGNVYASQQIESFLIEHQQSNNTSFEIKQGLSILTATEKVILKLISNGISSHEIASHLFISSNTVDNHRANITKKLQLEGKNSLLKFAMQHKQILG